MDGLTFYDWRRWWAPDWECQGQPAPASEQHGWPCVNIEYNAETDCSQWAGCKFPEQCASLRACQGVPF